MINKASLLLSQAMWGLERKAEIEKGKALLQAKVSTEHAFLRGTSHPPQDLVRLELICSPAPPQRNLLASGLMLCFLSLRDQSPSLMH